MGERGKSSLLERNGGRARKSRPQPDAAKKKGRIAHLVPVRGSNAGASEEGVTAERMCREKITQRSKRGAQCRLGGPSDRARSQGGNERRPLSLWGKGHEAADASRVLS